MRLCKVWKTRKGNVSTLQSIFLVLFQMYENETKHKDSCLRVEAATPVQFKTHLDELVTVPEEFKLLSDFMTM